MDDDEEEDEDDDEDEDEEEDEEEDEDEAAGMSGEESIAFSSTRVMPLLAHSVASLLK